MEKAIKNCIVSPSIPGDLPLLSEFIAQIISASVIGPSRS